MAALPTAPDFEQALADLQAHLPDRWDTQDPTSSLYMLLAAWGQSIDRLAEIGEQIHLDRRLHTATLEGLLRNFAFAWGLTSEPLPSDLTQLVAYIEARTLEDGSLLGMVNTLTTLVEAPINLLGGPLLTFPNAWNLIGDPNFTHDTLGAFGTAWWSESSGHGGAIGVQVSNDWAPSGSTRSLKVIYTATANPLDTGTIQNVLNQLPVTPGQPMTAQATFNVTAITPGIGVDVTINWRDASNTPIGATVRSGHEITAVGIQTISFPVTPPPGAAFAFFTIFCEGRGTAGTAAFYLGNILFGQGPYGDGDRPGWGWSGAPGNSASSAILSFPDVNATALPFTTDGKGIPLPAAFVGQPAGLPLYEFTPGNAPSVGVGITFPGAGGGAQFPSDPLTTISGNVIVNDGSIPTGSGSGLKFASNSLVQVLPNFPGYQLTVHVQSWLAFDRGAFARAVARFQPADWLPTRVVEISS